MRILAVAIVLFVALLVNAQLVLACNMTITPATATGKVGDVITFTISIQKTHRNCIVPIDETEIRLKNMEIVNQTLWQKVSSDVDRKQVTVRLTQAGEGLLEVIRECHKGGDYQTVRVIISEPSSQTTPPPQTPSRATTPTEMPKPTVTPQAPTTEKSETEIGWAEAIAYTIKQPNIIATFAFMAIGTLALMRNYHRFRHLVLLASMAYLGFALGGCLCALGALQNVILWVGEIKYRLASYILLGIPIIAAVLFGRVFCGWVCPMGAVQHFIFKKETGKKAKNFEPGPRLHNILRFCKYLMLVVLVTAVVLTKTRVFSDIDPFKALFNLDFALIPTVILILLLAASLVIGFPWCRYVCPLGAFIALFSRYSIYKVRIGDKCINCKACHTTFCDYRAIQPGETKPDIRSLECVRCGECISRCPYDAISFTAKAYLEKASRDKTR